MAQQTAVEWLLNEIADNFKTPNQWKKVIDQAKAMEKEQIFNFVKTMPISGGITQEGESYVQYNITKHYNETYGK
jgi:hypothetical protein